MQRLERSKYTWKIMLKLDWYVIRVLGIEQGLQNLEILGSEKADVSYELVVPLSSVWTGCQKYKI